MFLGDITQKIQNIDRLRHILQVLVKYGFGYIIDCLKIDQNIIRRNLIMFGPIKKLDIFDLIISGFKFRNWTTVFPVG
jgi:hypothetical protein